MKCNNCGLENEQTASFCANCGCPLNSEPSPITEVDENKLYTRRKIIDIATDKHFLKENN